MNYPLLSEYIEAIRTAEDNFNELTNLRPVLDNDGQPIMSSGNFAVVFKMRDEQTRKLHAVKCFLKEQEGRAEAYRLIAEELEYVSSTFLTPIKYLDKELFVDSNASDETEFPVLLMDWVEGLTLDKYIREHIDDEYQLSLLTYQFSRLAMWLMPQPFAHGDLKPDNILVRDDGTLVLVDYDGMYVPAMKGQKARELGSPDFRHPNRTESDFDEHIDDFSLATILLSLKAIALQPSLLEEYSASDRLLFSENDYRKISESKVMDALKPLMLNAELASLYSLFILAISQNNLSQISFRLFNLSRPERPQYEEENLSTEVTEEELANAWTDEYGVLYSADRKRLLKAPSNINKYSIIDGTMVICDRAFALSIMCNNSSISIPKSVKIIGKESFKFCTGLDYIYIPQSVRTIGYRAFENCQYIRRVDISDGLKHIGEGAFGNCFRLSSIILPNTIISIGDWAFCNCESLSSITIPESVKILGNNLFYRCNKLRELIVDKENKFFDSRNGCNAIVESSEDSLRAICPNSVIPNNIRKISACGFAGLERFTSFKIPETVKVICDSAFEGCNELLSIVIPNNVETIGKSAFRGCNKLANVTICNGLKTIEEHAFDSCNNLTSISFPSTLSKIGDGAFCFASLVSVDIPKNIKEIGINPFENCSKLIYLSVDKKNPKYDSRENCHAIIETSTNTLISSCSNSIIPHGTNKLGERSFCGTKITSLEIPDSVREIEDWAFAYSSLSSLVIPNSVLKIGFFIFDNCEKLKLITIPNSLNSIDRFEFFEGIDTDGCTFSDIMEIIGVSAFGHCNSQCVILISKGTRNKYEKMFPYDKEKLVEQNECEKLCIKVTEDDLANAWTDEYGVKYSSDRKRLLWVPSNISHYLIKEGTIMICDEAFNDGPMSSNNHLLYVFIPNTVTHIGNGAFSGCFSLETINIPNSVIYIGNNAFSHCYNINPTIPNSVNYIGDGAFCNCRSLSINVIPKSVSYIGSSAFANCYSLTQIKILGKIGTIKDRSFADCFELNGVLLPSSVTHIEKGAFSECYKLDNINIPETIQCIDDYAFEDCRALLRIVLPNTLTHLGNGVFRNCESLTQINIPDSISHINKFVFQDCYSLSNVSIPVSVTCIKEAAFQCCGIKHLVFHNTTVDMSNDSFEYCDSLESIMIPKESKDYFEKLLPEYKDILVENNGWSESGRRHFTQDEIDAVERTIVVASQYGNSVCFFFKSGGETSIPLSQFSTLTIGDSLDLKTAKLITLSRDGDDDIYRVIE